MRPNRTNPLAVTPGPRHPVFHIPHDGRFFPPELMTEVCVPREELLACHRMMRDQDVRLLVPPFIAGSRVVFPVSRLLCDVERFIGPEEIMERYGMGFCYERVWDGRRIKRVTERGREAARRWYDAHHRRMNLLCARHGRVLLFDLHSYHDAILPPFARRPGRDTPDLCIGTDPRFTPPQLRERVRACFTAAGFTTAENVPYEGLYVPEDVMDGRCGCDFAGVMLEFHRRAYCGRGGAADPGRIALIRSLIGQLAEEGARL